MPKPRPKQAPHVHACQCKEHVCIHTIRCYPQRASECLNSTFLPAFDVDLALPNFAAAFGATPFAPLGLALSPAKPLRVLLLSNCRWNAKSASLCFASIASYRSQERRQQRTTRKYRQLLLFVDPAAMACCPGLDVPLIQFEV